MRRSQVRQSVTYMVHPLAAIFPMMSEEDLQAMAADIKANGLREPIVIGDWVDDDGEVHQVIIDGRNREKACEIAEVEPDYVQLNNGQDAAAYIISANLHRRNMNKGQQAMMLAMIHPEGGHLGPGQHDPAITAVQNTAVNGERRFSAERLRQARQLLRLCRALPDDEPKRLYPEEVARGTLTLNTALDDILGRLRDDDVTTNRRRALRETRPDLDDLVEGRQMTLADAEAKAREDEQFARNQRDTIFKTVRDWLRCGEALLNGPEYDELPEWLRSGRYDDELRQYFRRGSEELIARSERLQEATDQLLSLISQIEESPS